MAGEKKIKLHIVVLALAVCSELVHTLIGTYKSETGTYDRLTAVSPNLPETMKIGYPILVDDLDDGYVGKGWSWGGPSRGMGAKFYTGTDHGNVISSEIYSDEFYKEMGELHWVMLRSYGRLDAGTYRIAGGNLNGISSTEHNWFSDIWVVDLKAMKIVARKRFTDEPLPDAIRYTSGTNGVEDDYNKAQEERLDQEIASWILESTR
jgi:hypothetical protein